ncbi:MAG: hypothetical protein V8T86_18865 [Victivallis sp.]
MHHLPKGVELIVKDGFRLPVLSDFLRKSCFLLFFSAFFTGHRGFRGNWENAALIYRKWMEENDKSLPEKLFSNPQIPDWLKESPVVLIYPVKGNGFDTGSVSGNEYFPYSNALPTVADMPPAGIAGSWLC